MQYLISDMGSFLFFKLKLKLFHDTSPSLFHTSGNTKQIRKMSFALEDTLDRNIRHYSSIHASEHNHRNYNVSLVAFITNTLSPFLL